MKNLAILVFVLLASCGDNSIKEQQLYTCSVEQMEIVEKQIQVCDDAGYITHLCYAWAKIEQCTKMEKNVE